MKILLVDDDPFVLKLMSIQLRAFGLARMGYVDVICCESGAEAVEQLEQDDRIRLVFCDLQMPGMDGVELVRQLVQLKFRGGLVLVSGEPARTRRAVEQLAHAHGLKLLGALGKPVESEALLKLLDAAIPETRAPRAPEQARYSPADLQLAINRREMVNHYQPKVELATGNVVGFEALVRWHHPQDGLVLPNRFVPMSEEHGLIGYLGVEVLRNALRDLRSWHEAGYPLDVSVNVSLTSVSSLDYPDFLMEQAAEAGVSLRHLILEITESRLMDNPQIQLDVLTRLRLRQVKLSIDDFGTGYSCLAQLRDLPIDELKIDRGFVHHASTNPALRAILDASLGLGRELGLSTVAEGVEDRADWDLLRGTTCDMVQGNLVAKPMPAARVIEWLAAWERRRHELFS